MAQRLSPMWWSRLVLSVRGYVINYYRLQDDMQFMCDDTFIMIHQHVVESNDEIAKQFLSDLEVIVNFDNLTETLQRLDKGDAVQRNPFTDDATKESFQRIFGQPNEATYRIANAQKMGFMIFMGILSTLQQRWVKETKKRKGIRFEEDPEWQPDQRVVLFEHFFEGNRTWVLLDFDRHVLNYWKPDGSSVIFGDRFIEDKKRLGFGLCAVCGILEQRVDQFPQHDNKRFCSPKCADEYEAKQHANG